LQDAVGEGAARRFAVWSAMPTDVLPESAWPPMPAPQRETLQRVLAALASNPEVLGVAAGGSFAARTMDAFSDLDLLVVADPAAWPAILDRRRAIAASAGALLAAFTGEHVREPRLLICLYGPPLVHVDLKFLTPSQLGERVEDPVVLLDRTGAVRQGLEGGRALYPQPDLQWIEDRFWVWIHYAATKLGRGELFEVLDVCGHLRTQVLGPLLLAGAGAQPNGVRRIEAAVPAAIERLRATVAPYDAPGGAAALHAAIREYRALRDGGQPVERRNAVEAAAVTYLTEVAAEVERQADCDTGRPGSRE
jgi:hypothetical protein